jgi:polar amino acid transport system substrate-binding protein
MFRTPHRSLLGLAVAATLTVSMAACGSESESGSGTGSAGAPAPSSSVDTALAAKIPAEVKSAGKLIVGTDTTYAPNEFLDSDGKTAIGFDIDLFTAIAGKFGVPAEFRSDTFGNIIPGLGTGKYDVGISSFTINADRLKQVNMVSYFSAGTQWAAKKGAGVDPDNACGKKVAVQATTVQVDDITARSKKCTDAGKPKITIDQYQKQNDATNAVVTGKDDAMLADSPVCAYAVKQTNGQLELAGDIYDSAPYGIVVPKDQADFADAIKQAVQALITDGTYKTIATKWGVEAGAITTPEVNPKV